MGHCQFSILERVHFWGDAPRVELSLSKEGIIMGSLSFRTTMLRIRNDLSVIQESIYIKTNPRSYLKARVEVLSKRDNNVLHQLEFV